MPAFRFPSLRRWLPVLALAAAMTGPGTAQASNTENWWVYVANDNADQVRTLLAQGADPNIRYRNGQPALMRAVADDAWQVFDAIAADRRTDLNVENPAGETPLMYLALAGQTERAAALIARGAHVNRLGWTPLHYAASKGQVGTARLLIRHKAIVNAPSPRGVTPLMMAGFSGSREMVNLLLGAGADSTTRDLDGKNAADWAAQGKSDRLAEDLRDVIARAEAAREALRRAPVPGGPAAGRASPAPAAPTRSGDASGKGGSPSVEPSVSGVSGVRLHDYDSDGNP